MKMLDNTGFDIWSNGYDKNVNLSDESNEYPFDGYKNVLNYIYKQVREKSNANILDIGFGTGILTTQLYNSGYSITGIDFSSNMIGIAKKKMPQATLINCDFSKGLPDEGKNNLIKLLYNMLTKTGEIFLGDVSFKTRDELDKCREIYNKQWDNDEFYFISEEIKRNLVSECLCKYAKISQCAGVLTITNK